METFGTSVRVKFASTENVYKQDDIVPVVTHSDLHSPADKLVGKANRELKAGEVVERREKALYSE